MKKTLLISIALLTVSTVFATAAGDAIKGIKVNDGSKKQFESVKHDTERHIGLSHDNSGVSDTRSLLIKDASKTRIKPDTKELRRQSILIKHQDEIDKQKSHATIRQSKTALEKDLQSKAFKRAEMRDAQARPDQFSQPFNANGNFELTSVKYQYDFNSGEFSDYAERNYTYDASGNVTGYITTYINKDNILNKSEFAPVTIPFDAKVIVDNNIAGGTEEVYYIDPATQKRYDIYLYENVYKTIGSNRILVSRSTKSRDKDGNLRERVETESKVDDQGRPIETVNYEANKSGIYEPYSKYEFQYPDGNLIRRTTSYWEKDENGKGYWSISYIYVYGTDSEGYTHYEYDVYDSENSVWYGYSKYKYIDSATEYTRIRWAWNYDKKEWVLNSKEIKKYNSKDYRISEEYLLYDETLESFYLNRKYGYEYLGDTLQIADWYIYYNKPKTKEELANQESLISRGEMNDYMPYTEKELNIKLTDYPDLDLPDKYIICSTLEKDPNNDGKFIWVKYSKSEFKYALAPEDYTTTDLEFKITDQKDFDWDSDIKNWILTYEYKKEYDDYGEQTLYEEYYNNQIYSHEKYQYKYIVSNRYGEPELIQLTVLEEYCKDWDITLDTWTDGTKKTYEYNDAGRQIAYYYYFWNQSKKTWDGYYYYLTGYNKYGTAVKWEMFIGNGLDAEGIATWIPYDFEERTINDNGQKSLSIYYSDWDVQANAWTSGTKTEWTYNTKGYILTKLVYNYSEGQWVDSVKTEYGYNGRGYPVSIICSVYNPENKSWAKEWREQYEYNAAGDPINWYYYNYDAQGKEILTEKDIILYDGNNATYTYYILNDKGEWEYYTKYEIVWDFATYTYTETGYKWNSEKNDWIYTYKEIWGYDADNNLILDEYYSWDTVKEAWVGEEDGKEEYAYDADGNEIMHAYYDWDYDLNEWVGTEKEEEAYDANDNLLLYAEYEWDYNKKDWFGIDYKEVYEYDDKGNCTLYAEYEWDDETWSWYGSWKSEHEYDADGILVMSTYYYETDSQGNWIGDEKYSNYTKNGVKHYECCYWNYEKNDWEGDTKYNYYSDNKGYWEEYYEWDYKEWCWIGRNKYEYVFTENGGTYTYYEWDKEKKNWVEDSKEDYVSTTTDNSIKTINTNYEWKNSQWVLECRSTSLSVYNSDDNLEYYLWSHELYDATEKKWTPDYSVKYIYQYAQRTIVESIAARATINVFEGVITVNAAESSSVIIVSVAGGEVAKGNGSLSVAVAPGIYLITVDGTTTKVSVR